LAYEVLELSGWAPSILRKEATVISFDKSTNEVTLKLHPAFLPQIEPEEPEDDEQALDLMPVEDTVTLNLNQLSDIRIIEAASGQ
jgi:hypothetical protein